MALLTVTDEKLCECIISDIIKDGCLHQRLCKTRSLDVHKPDAGRPRTTWTVSTEESVLQDVEHNPSTSTRAVSRNTHIPQSTIWRIVHDGGLHSFHLQRVRTLEPEDYNKIIEFSKWYLQETATDRNFAASVFFTDEAAFSLEDVVKIHNLHHWADENPHDSHASQRKFTLNIWAGIVEGSLLGLYILPEMLNISLCICCHIQFQQNGALAHFSRQVTHKFTSTGHLSEALDWSR